MPSTTSHYGFEQPYGNEQLAPTNFNDNWGKLDTMFYQMSQRVSTLERIAIPIGGTQGQPLLKASSNDNDVTWGTLDVHHGGTGAIDATTARANLDAARTKHEHPASDITSGALALARGGTGIDNSVNIPSKTFFAAPTNNSGAASFRLIVEADLPNISAAKITSGVLALARGGTGVDNSTGRTAKTFFAAPTANAGSASFRTIDEADLPNLNASKITGGTFAVDRIPNISGTKINDNTLASSKITGTIAIAKGGTGATTGAGALGNLGVKRGVVTITTTAAYYIDSKITFSGVKFTAVPNVQLTLQFAWQTPNTTNSEQAASLTPVVHAVSATELTIRLWNRSVAKGTNIQVQWLAIGNV